MNVGQARVAIRERGVAEIVDLAFRFIIALGRRLYLRLFLVVIVPAIAFAGLLMWQKLSWSSIWLSSLLVFVLCQLPFTIAASRLLFSENVSLREVLVASLRASPRYLGAMILAALLLAFGTLLPIVLPFALARALYMAEIVVLEGTDLAASYRRSLRFTQHRLWAALEVTTILILLTLSFVVFCEVLASSLLSSDLFELEPLSELLKTRASPFAIAGLLLAAPVVATARFLAYIDGRTRREAWDVQVRFMQLASDEQARAA